MRYLVLIVVGCVLLLACQPSQAQDAGAQARAADARVQTADYPWLAALDGEVPVTSLEARFAPPKGFKRVEAQGFGAWLRGLPVRKDRREVLSFRGDVLGSPSEAVVYLDVGERDLQQCADSVLRLHAEYLWHKGRADEVAYHFTSGDRSSWKAWRGGEFFKIEGAKVKRGRGKGRRNDHAEFRRYLDHMFRYAGTQSLGLDSERVTLGEDLRAGDFFVQPGGPGHAVMLLDIAQHADGRRVALVGQGYMPAQEFHVVRAKGGHVLEGVWFVLPRSAGEVLDTPSWRAFTMEQARRLR